MYYVKDNNGNKINLNGAPVYTTCPVCYEDHQVNEFWELLAENPDFDMQFGVYCDACSKEYEEKQAEIRGLSDHSKDKRHGLRLTPRKNAPKGS